MNSPSEVYYVVLRGAGRQPLFEDDEGRRHFTEVVAEAVAACGVIVHAYSWLDTEARLAVEPREVPVGRFAQWIADHHRKRFRRRISMTGSHFEQKYRGVPVDGRTELPHLVRHIHLAPLKAGMTADLASYPWSSHCTYLGTTSTPWISTDAALQQLADAGTDARLAYLEFMKRGLQELGLPAPAASGLQPDDSGDTLPRE